MAQTSARYSRSGDQRTHPISDVASGWRDDRCAYDRTMSRGNMDPPIAKDCAVGDRKPGNVSGHIWTDVAEDQLAAIHAAGVLLEPEADR